MLKLEPYIFDELKKSNLLIDDLKKKVHDVTNVDISQIEFRVNKLIQQEKLSNDKGIVSIKKQSSNQDEDEELIKITKEFMKRKFKKFMKDNWTEKYNTKCFYPDKSKCTKKIVAAHSIQNNRHLIKLADKGVVMQIKAVDAYFTGDATRVGRKIATTFNGFCSEHDNSLFKPIEEKNYNLNNKEQEFLLAYRAFAREYFVKKSVQLGYQKAQTKYPNDNYIKDFLEGTKIGIRDLDFWKDIFDKALLEKDYNQISTMSFIINKKCNLAVSSIFDIEYDFEGNSVNDLGKKEVILKPLFLTVFPQDNKTVILTSYFKKDKQSFNLIEKQLSKFNEDILLEKISLLIALYCENFIFAPKKWETMNKKQKDEFLKDFLTKGPGTIKSRDLIDKPKFNLFF